MNKTIACSILLLLCSAGKTNAQTGVYHPMPDSNATWCETASYGITCGITERKLLLINGDTTIGSFQYHKLTATGYQNCISSYSYFTDQYRGAFRDDTVARKVYMVDPSTTTEYVLYDFTLGIGDTTPASNFGPGAVITSIDSVLVGAVFHKRYWVSSSMMPPDSAQIVEGVGSSCGFFLLTWQGVEYVSRLNSYSENAIEIFIPDSTNGCQLMLGVAAPESMDKVTMDVSPNPNAGAFTVSYLSSQRSDVSMELIDITGRTLERTEFVGVTYFNCDIRNEILPEGIYFIRVTNGEVVLTKRVVVQN